LDTQIRNLEGDLESGKTTLDAEIANYESQVVDFEKKKAEFERKIDEWNSKRGGSQEEYDALLREQDALAKESDRLNSIARKLNVSANSYNSQVSQFNQTIDTFSKVLEEKPEEGLYDPNKEEIDIYFNNDRDKLIRTMAHELGHARSLGHTNDEKDMMYPITTSVLELTATDLNLLNKICEPYPIYEPYLENMINNLQLLKMSILSK
jgi:chromosome segregation ATPase